MKTNNFLPPLPCEKVYDLSHGTRRNIVRQVWGKVRMEGGSIGIFLALVIFGTGGGVGTTVWSQSASSKRKELQRVQKQLEQKKREIEEFRRESDGLKHDLSRLAVETSESKRKVRTLQKRIDDAQQRKADLKAQLGALQLAEGRWQGVLAEEVRGYVGQRFGQSEYYGRRPLWEAMLSRAAILEKARYVEHIHGFKHKTEQAEEDVRRQKLQLQAKTDQAREEHRTRESLYRRKQEVYKETEQKVAQTRQAIDDLQNSAIALTQLVRTLERQSPYRQGGAVPLAEPPHSLPWPAEGRVVSSFGKQLVPSLHTWIINQGVRLATAKGAAVHPVKKGKVIFSGSFRSYGQVVIVDHGQAFFSIYGMLGSMSKKKGDRVGPADVLGKAGSAAEGGAVYFEIRQSGDALDPLNWLKSR